MKKVLLSIILLGLILNISPAYAKKAQGSDILNSQTQLQKRQFQTRNYDCTDKALIMKKKYKRGVSIFARRNHFCFSTIL